MGLLVKTAQVTESSIKGSGRIASRIAKKHPTAAKATAIGTAAYTVGALHANSVRKAHPEFYDKTPSNFRAEDRHPESGYYGQ